MSRAARQAHDITRGRTSLHPQGRVPRVSFSRLAAATGIVLGGGWLLSACCVVGFSLYDGADGTRVRSTPLSDAIVVLGAAQYDGRPSPVLRARIDHALSLWRRNVAGTLVFTGGTGHGDTTSEAVVSGTYARRRGVPEGAIVLESAGRTTSQSMHAVSLLLRVRHAKSIVLVSDPFHMFRLRILAHKVGLQARTSPTRTSPIGASIKRNAGYIFSESLKAPIAFLIE
jgi:uncharacterized SAM-binding protein YcdF (DUF218 family)